MNTSGSSYDEGPVLKVNTTEFKGGIWCEIQQSSGQEEPEGLLDFILQKQERM